MPLEPIQFSLRMCMKIRSTMYSSFAVTLFALSSPNTSKAADGAMGLFVEPMVTFELGNSSVNYPSPLSSSTGTIEGLGIGARAGVHLLEVLFVGLDGRYAMPRFRDSTASYDTRATSANWGPVVGAQMPIVGLRVWGSYIVGGEMNPEESGSLDVKFQKGTGYRVGAGFRIMFVSLNLEYQQLKYGQTTLERVGPFSGASALDNVQLDNKSWIASVSMPFEL